MRAGRGAPTFYGGPETSENARSGAKAEAMGESDDADGIDEKC